MFNRYNTRAGRYSTGSFVPPRELSAGAPHAKSYVEPSQNAPQAMHQNMQPNKQFNTPVGQRTPPAPYNANDMPNEPEDIPVEQPMAPDVKAEPVGEAADEAAFQRPAWMKSKLQGVKKISNRERRRRQNENLRRLLSPKNALMVLNEIMPGENNFRVEAVPPVGQYYKQNTNNFCADLQFEGNSYKGYGDNKMAARNAAAEQAVRDLLLRRMAAAFANASVPHEERGENGENAEVETIEDLPMIQLASFALHKLFAEWECQGHRVPTLRPTSASMSDAASDAGSAPTPLCAPPPAPAPARRQLPADAPAMHPCMLLSHMRPGLTYREAGAEGDRPQNMVFTMELDVDGHVYSGRACNKREARKAAARAACRDLFGVCFADDPK